MIHLLGFLVFPLMAGLAAVAPLAVEVVFGPKWAPAAPLIQIMVLFGALRSLNNPAGALLLAKGLVEKSFVLNLILAVVYGVAFRWAVTLGVAAVCWTAVAILAAYMMLSWRTLYGNTIGLTPGEYIQAVIRPVAISLIMALCVLVAQSLLERLGVPPLLRLGSLIAIGAAIYLAVAVLLDHEYTKRLAGMLRFRRAAAPTDAL